MTRKMAYIGTSYFIGLFFASFISFENSLLIGMLSVAISLFLAILKLKRTKCILLCLSFLSLAMIWYGVYGIFIYNDIISVSGNDIELTGVVSERSDFADDNSSYILDTEINNHKTKVIVYTDSVFDVGDKIIICGTPYIPKNSYIFPQKDYYMTNGIFMCVDADEYTKIKHIVTPNSIASSYRDYLSSEIDHLAPGREGELMKALVFGDKSGMNDEVRGYFSKSGISHIISVSGFHLAVVCGIVFYLLKIMNLGKIPRFIISEIFIFAFAALAGFSFSVVRSGIMMTIFLSSDLVRRRHDIFSSLGTAFIILTLTMPFAVRNTSLLLSVTGVFGIGIVAPYLTKDVNFGNPVDKPLKILIYSAICSLTTLPFVLLTFREISIISPLSNLILVPLCSFILILGIIIALTAGIEIISAPLIILGGIASKLVIFVTEFLSLLPFSTISFEYDILVLIVFIFFIVVSLAFIIFKDRKFTVITILFSVCFVVLSDIYTDISTKDNLSVTVFSGKYSSVVIEKAEDITIITKDGRKQENAVYTYLSERGEKHIDNFIVTSNPQYYISSYNDILYDVYADNVFVSDKSGIPEIEVMGSMPEFYEDRITLEYDEYIIEVYNDNIYINYNDFSMLCADNSEFEDKDYSVTFFKDIPDSVSSGYMLDSSETETGYGVITDGEKIRVVVL